MGPKKITKDLTSEFQQSELMPQGSRTLRSGKVRESPETDKHSESTTEGKKGRKEIIKSVLKPNKEETYNII